MKTALTFAGLTLALSGLAGCGGDDGGGGGIPADASTDEFCGNFETLADDLGEFSADSDPADVIVKMQDAAERMRETGVPDSASDDAREGLETTLDAIDSLGEEATLEDIGNLEDSFSDEDQKKADAFDDYLDEECGDL